MPPERARGSATGRVLVALMLVAAVVVVAFLGWRAFDAAAGLRGDDVLVVEKRSDVEGAFQLNATRTHEELPAFGALLDEAWLGGKSSTNDPELVAQVRAYMDALAQAQGHARFDQPPYENVLAWGEGEDAKTLRLLYL